MKKFLVITVLALFLALSLISTAPVLAANELTFNADTTINIPDLSINLTIKSGSVVDAMTANVGSISFTVSTGNSLTIESSNQRTMSLSPALAGQSFTCASPSIFTFSPQVGVSGQSVTLTPSTSACSGGSGATNSGISGPSTTTTPITPITSTTPTTPTPAAAATTPATTNTATKATDLIKNIMAEAATMTRHNVEQVLTAVRARQDAEIENAAEVKYTAKLVSDLKIPAEVKNAITYFTAYGTPTTKILGAGERAGVISSYKSAFGKVPATEADWSDAIKIGNGRWPTERSTESENNATTAFKKIYKRSSDRKNPHDDAAVTVMAYGLRPSNRNLNSEKAAIKSFRAIYGYDPKTATAWDIVRAIAYSGAKR